MASFWCLLDGAHGKAFAVRIIRTNNHCHDYLAAYNSDTLPYSAATGIQKKKETHALHYRSRYQRCALCRKCQRLPGKDIKQRRSLYRLGV